MISLRTNRKEIKNPKATGRFRVQNQSKKNYFKDLSATVLHLQLLSLIAVRVLQPDGQVFFLFGLGLQEAEKHPGNFLHPLFQFPDLLRLLGDKSVSFNI